MTYTINPNTKYNSLEISFDAKPSIAIRDILKSLKFRWNPKKSIWYGFADEKELKEALEKASPVKKSNKKEAKEIAFSHDLRAGDILYMDWGYEQTNINLFLITKASASCVWVKECTLPINKEEASCSMSRYISYDLSKPTIKNHSIFTEQEGDGSRFKVNGNQIHIKGYIASKYDGEKLYESWYY